ncbi:hypothetical protein B7494_g7834 [Chlorociboria aeruginascens]|nr:hypothetical protein B7494_g7834 [Chlorociboria aeruginascens]
MVLGIITSIAACPAIIGTTEAVRQGQRQNAKEKHRGRKANLLLYVTTVKTHPKFPPDGPHERIQKEGHLFAGYFFPYPNSDWGRRGEGYVSTISDDPPQLNWIYVDKETYEVKYGLKVQAEGQLVGPWNCTPVDRRLMFQGWEGFTVVEEEEGVWALYFDVEDNGLEGIVSPEKRIMEVELTRREMRIAKGEGGFGT